MTIYNRNFAKPAADDTPLYGPMPLGVEIPHHDEWDEPVIDPETGEPTGETQHTERDWVEKRTVIHPTAEDFKLMGYLPLVDEPPSDPPQGQHYERNGTIEPNGDSYKWVYILVPDPPAPPVDYSKRKLYRVFLERGVWPQVKAWMEAQGIWEDWEYATTLQSDDPLMVAAIPALKALLGVTDAELADIFAACAADTGN